MRSAKSGRSCIERGVWIDYLDGQVVQGKGSSKCDSLKSEIVVEVI